MFSTPTPGQRRRYIAAGCIILLLIPFQVIYAQHHRFLYPSIFLQAILLTYLLTRIGWRFLDNMLTVCWSVVITLSLAEVSARTYIKLFPEKAVHDAYEYRKQQPPPYKRSAYFNTDFVRESLTNPGKWYTPPGTRLVLPADYRGKYFNTQKGLRRTTDQPPSYINSIYVFGGSTIYCSEVPDSFTVSSYLQRMVNERFLNTYRVVNYGTTTVNSSQELERLKTLNLREGDVVIFYDGVNDILQSLYNARPQGWIVESNRDAMQGMTMLDRWRFSAYDGLSDKSAFVYLFLYPYRDEVKPHLKNPKELKSLSRQMQRQYVTNMATADGYCKARQAYFYHFLQANLFTKDSLTEYEQDLMGKPFFIPSGMKIAFREGNPALKKAQKTLQAINVASYDLTDVLNGTGTEIYLDYCHVTEKGNEAIAKGIFAQIGDELSPTGW